LEKYGVIWVWMGEPAAVDPDAIPDFSFITAKNYRSVFGYSHVKANYEMVSDNLLDLSHVHYLHQSTGASPVTDFSKFENRIQQDGNTVWSMLWQRDYEPQPSLRTFWRSTSPRGDGQGHVRWDPPALLLAQRGITEVGRPMEEGVQMPTAHLITPETEYSTHYFWVVGRTSRLDEPELDLQLRELAGRIFDTEDCPMIAAQQEGMGEATDFLTQHPIILKADAAGIRARLVLKNLIRAEQVEMHQQGVTDNTPSDGPRADAVLANTQ
jgi:vanillate O-demethylase monooxygenase subunit